MTYQTFWCHECRLSFQHTENPAPLQCSTCNGCFIEQLLTDYSELEEENPESFRAERSTLTSAIPDAVVTDGITQVIDQVVSYFRRSDNFGGGRSQVSVHIHSAMPSFDQSYEDLLHQLLMHSSGPRGIPPASQKFISQIISKKTENSKEPTDCPVCREKVVEVVALDCGHKFCEECIIPWLQKHSNCPVCREEFETDDLEYEASKRNRNTTDTRLSTASSSSSTLQQPSQAMLSDSDAT